MEAVSFSYSVPVRQLCDASDSVILHTISSSPPFLICFGISAVFKGSVPFLYIFPVYFLLFVVITSHVDILYFITEVVGTLSTGLAQFSLSENSPDGS